MSSLSNPEEELHRLEQSQANLLGISLEEFRLARARQEEFIDRHGRNMNAMIAASSRGEAPWLHPYLVIPRNQPEEQGREQQEDEGHSNVRDGHDQQPGGPREEDQQQEAADTRNVNLVAPNFLAQAIFGNNNVNEEDGAPTDPRQHLLLIIDECLEMLKDDDLLENEDDHEEENPFFRLPGDHHDQQQ
eukprot:CAMPEP_0172453816 /NCGR_PEP_ID=MMETSP1065-20121228/10984_1 /TAXON_ID=265537 /ORGANISM="Amphiprora paludosa, Strain CCMP125" /LENGTH=188 /DNA_ID=CAMNT_0013206037 /DNA_START=261 /DNA_END=827 /DNA_ORIENTATION=-